MLALAAVGAVNAVIAGFYYLNVVRYMFFVDNDEGKEVRIHAGLKTTLIISAVMVLVVGILAQPVIMWAMKSTGMTIAIGF